MLLLVSTALAFEHADHLVGPDGLALHVTQVDAAGLPAQAVQLAFEHGLAQVRDDDCVTIPMETLSIADNPEMQTDGVSTLSVDLLPGGVQLELGDPERRGERGYATVIEADMALPPGSYALDDEVLSGVCEGRSLPRRALLQVLEVLGLRPPADPKVESVFNQPDCSPATLSADDRDGLRQLYGSGIAIHCEEAGERHGVAPLQASEACTVTPYGGLDLLWVEWRFSDGQRSFDLESVAFDEPGFYTVEACATFEATGGCHYNQHCVEVEQVQWLVCQEEEPKTKVGLKLDHVLVLEDLTTFDVPGCVDGRSWTITAPDGSHYAEVHGVNEEMWLHEEGTYTIDFERTIAGRTQRRQILVEHVPAADGTTEVSTTSPALPSEDSGDSGVAPHARAPDDCGCASASAIELGGEWLVAWWALARRRD